MLKVHYDYNAEESIGRYFEDYQGSALQNDMQKRAFHVSRIIACLAHIDVYFEETFIINGKNYIEIDGICIVEFEVKENLSEVVIMNVFFK